MPSIRSFDQLYIGGRWVQPQGSQTLRAVNPVTEQEVAVSIEPSTADVDDAVAAARRAFDEGPWPRMSPRERGEALARVHDELAKRLEELVEVNIAEIGATEAVSRGFLGIALDVWQDASRLHEWWDFEQERSWDGQSGLVIHEPVGVVAAITPWNGPVTTTTLKLAPALAAGCTVVAKPSPEGPIGPLILAEAIEAAGLPEGVVSILPAGREIGEYLVSHPLVDKVTFTGSTAAGKRIMALCADRIARVTLELGGKSAAVIADDIDFGEVLPTLVPAGLGHSGQVCAALTRILVPRHRQGELVEQLRLLIDGMTVGDPADPATDLGPLVSRNQRDRVQSYLDLGIAEGARIVIGGDRALPDTGWFIAPTVFADVRNDMRIAREEIFGPVLCVIPFDSIDEAVDIANDSPYGLSGAVYSRDDALAISIARRVRTGQIGVNGWSVCVSQPFGGFKQSGLGREGGPEGIAAFLETKLIQYPG
jgi:acyl-CoA reductase-like NAD-dependent aldehyde dehydrogenase